MYRDEYISYPTAFILAAIISITTALDATEIFTSPIIIIALLTLFVAMGTLLIKRNRLIGWIATISLCLNFVTLGYMYPYIYSQVARAYIALLLYVLLAKRNNTKFIRSDLIVYLIFTALIPLTHSSESIAFFIAIATISLIFMVLGSTSRNRREVKQYFAKISIPFTGFIIVFFVWNVFQAKIMAISIYKMIIRSFEFALKAEATEAIARFTPYDYTQLEIITMIIGILSYGIVLLMLFIDTLVSILRRRTIKVLELTTIIALAIIAIVNIYIYLGTPYKSDLIWRFTFIFFVISSIFFAHKNGIYIGFVKRLLHGRGLLLTIILLSLFISSMFIYIKIQNVGSEYNTFSLSMREILEHSKVVSLLKQGDVSRYDVIFIDSPAMPYHILRDFIVVRIPIMQYVVNVDKVDIQFYKYRLMSGIPVYRFILLKKYSEVLSPHNYGDTVIVFHGADVYLYEVLNTIYNNGVFKISIT